MEMAPKVRVAALLSGLLQLWTVVSVVDAWSLDGHSIICSLARPFLTPATTTEVNNLMNSQFQHNFSTLCTWAEEVQFSPFYSWSPPLHFINTPDHNCSYNYSRDCVDVFGQPNYCASGAIKNYTDQLADPKSPYNRTESLLFLSNILGEIHQPLHVGFAGDGGGSFIYLWWLNTQNGSFTDLYSVWDSRIVHEAYERFYNKSNPTFNETLPDILSNMSLAIYSNLTADDASTWSACPSGPASCPDVYAEESIQLACQYAYSDVVANQMLTDDYFDSRLPIVEQRLLQSGVRLAATLNRLFDPSYVSPPWTSPPAPAVPTPSVSAPEGSTLPYPGLSPQPGMPTIPTPPLPSPPLPFGASFFAPPPTMGSGASLPSS